MKIKLEKEKIILKVKKKSIKGLNKGWKGCEKEKKEEWKKRMSWKANKGKEERRH